MSVMLSRELLLWYLFYLPSPSGGSLPMVGGGSRQGALSDFRPEVLDVTPLRLSAARSRGVSCRGFGLASLASPPPPPLFFSFL